MMNQDKESIKFDVPAGKAESLRRQFYAFIGALESQATKRIKAGDIKTAQFNTQQANTLRGYLVRIEVNGEPSHYTKYKDKRPAKLIFVNRDLDPLMSDVMSQLREQTSDSIALADEIVEKSVDSFFDKPLEVKNVHRSSEEPTD